jgi:Bacterial archaeo-eukaryotic release factor family 10
MPMITAQMVDRVVGFQGDGLPVLSLYASIEPGISKREIESRVTSLLDQADSLARDKSADHDRRLSLRRDIEHIRERLIEETWPPGGIALFSCSGRSLYEEVTLPRPARDQVMVDEVAFVRPMLAVLGEYHRTCVVVVDKAAASAWEFYQDELHELSAFRDQVLRKPNYAAGLAEYGVRNKADELVKRHYRRVAQTLGELVRTGGYELLVIGGHDNEVPAFLEFLPRELRDRVAGTFSIDPDAPPAAGIRAGAGAVLERYERAQEERAVAEVTDRASAGGLAVVGIESCLWAGTVAAIQRLLVEDDVTRAGVLCDESGWLALSGDTCPLCGKPTRRTADVINELVQTVIDEGGSVQHVEAETPLRDYVLAADLRFPLPTAAAAGGR